jgi:2-polyprenyl-3-methyl-5-hydroxy-6-metoxy-1,4-benzoquinol methylase
MNTVQIAKAVMKLTPVYPDSPEQKIGGLQEIFRHDAFVNGSDETRKRMMWASSEAKYQDEIDHPWDEYFEIDLAPWLRGKAALDLGCFTGGKSVAWFERYGLQAISGIDVVDVFIEAAQQFAAAKGVAANFRVARGETLPFADGAFDAIFCFDVLEHVQDPGKTLDECYRVLRPGGRLFLVFPSYYQPLEHHLSLVTLAPGIHYFFRGATLVRAYCEILNERGQDAHWYARAKPALEPWERCHTINGTTLRRFKRILQSRSWDVIHQSRKPIFSMGRNAPKQKTFRLLSKVLYPLTHAPGIQEVVLHRVTFVLGKTG